MNKYMRGGMNMKKMFSVMILAVCFMLVGSVSVSWANTDSEDYPKVERKGNAVVISYDNPESDSFIRAMLPYLGHVKAAYTFRVSQYGTGSKMVLITDLKENEKPYKNGSLISLSFDLNDEGREDLIRYLNGEYVSPINTAVIVTPLVGNRVILYIFNPAP